MTTENVAGTDSLPPRGARFYRCALQVNPHDYAQTYRGQTIQGDALSHAQEIVDKAVAMGIEVLAITDYKSVNGVAAFRAASRNKPVRIFPDFELFSRQPLEDLSTGQKATAVLLLLLLESGAPLLVDQPEDDLDNRFITEGIVPRMCEDKQRRQFIFSTHNANIPVLGDAELIVRLSAAGEAASGRARVAPEHTGSVDSRPVRELVEEILEGSREAFETRRWKYGF
ncbi:MAG: hypothetical protein OXF50_24545 [Caldilineaceae bacterium]|nr:hypothetical protein [Caldilineaceae bacterium]